MRKNLKLREWAKTDIRELKTLARGKTPAGKIAKALKRTEGATRQRAFSLGLSLDFRAHTGNSTITSFRPAALAGLTFVIWPVSGFEHTELLLRWSGAFTC